MVRYPEDFQESDMLGLYSFYRNGISIAVKKADVLYATFIIDDRIWPMTFEVIEDLQAVVEMVLEARG